MRIFLHLLAIWVLMWLFGLVAVYDPKRSESDFGD